ncbi:MAG TPA: phage major capsid protein [Terracidiphilus sp.]|nr:phage major capsid protein [Terracidiphilus sp.]
MTLQEMKLAQKEALESAEAQVRAAETAGRGMTDAESENYNTAMARYRSLTTTVRAREEQNTIMSVFPNGQPIVEQPRNRVAAFRRVAPWRTEAYLSDFAAYIMGAGKGASGADLHLGADELGGYKVPGLSAASYEGGSTSGVPIVPVVIEQQIVPLAPPVIGIESIASVIPTTTDLKFPRKTAHGTAALKAEGTGSGSNLFTGTSPTIDQYTLSAFMVGHPEDISWELTQDVPAFMSFLQDDLLQSIAVKKDALFMTGSGSSQPQGLKGNVAAGLTGVTADSNGNTLPLTAALTLTGKLNPVYRPNARFLMTVATGIELRAAQLQANLFNPAFITGPDMQDRLYGFPITYDSNVDEIGASATPLYFGDFKAGYQIGIRGGAGINIKFLDQPKALEGLLTILGYQRVDGRVRRSEAIQSLALASSNF